LLTKRNIKEKISTRMIINNNTWPTIEAKFNKIYEKEKTKQQKSEIHGQKPGKREENKKKRTNEGSKRSKSIRSLV
jgi:hypothetical protein